MRVSNIPFCSKFYDSLDSMFENYANNEGIDPYKKFASALGYSGTDRATQIYRKLNPNCPEYRFYADELVFLVREMGAYSAPVAHYFMSVASAPMQTRQFSLSQTASAFSKVFGDFNSRLIEAMADGSVSDSERATLVPLVDNAILKLQLIRSTLSPEVQNADS